MTNISIYGKTNKKNHIVKVATKGLDSVEKSVLPDIDISKAKKFDKNYISDDKNQIFYIDLSEDISIITQYTDALDSTASCNTVEKSEFNKLKFVFVGLKNASGKWKIKFQRLYPRYCFERAFFTFDNECKLQDPENIIILDSRTDAFYSEQDNKIYFYDFQKANSIVDLMKFYRDANEEDYKKLKNVPFLSCSIDFQRIGQRAGKKIAQLIDDKVLENKNADLLSFQKYAQKYEKEFTLTSDEKIKIDTMEDLNLLFDVAEERFFTKERSKEKCRTNSYERIGG